MKPTSFEASRISYRNHLRPSVKHLILLEVTSLEPRVAKYASSSMCKGDKIDSTNFVVHRKSHNRNPPQAHLELIISEKATQNLFMKFATCNKNTWRVITSSDENRHTRRGQLLSTLISIRNFESERTYSVGHRLNVRS